MIHYPIYTDLNFIKSFIADFMLKTNESEYSKILFEDNDNTLFFKLLFNSSIVYLNNTVEEIEQEAKINPYIKKLQKGKIKLNSTLNSLYNPPFEIDKVEPHALFCLSINKYETWQFKEKYGMNFISIEEFSELKYLFKNNHYNFPPSNQNDYENNFTVELLQCNSMVFTDNYFFSNEDTKQISSTLKRILKKCIHPKQTTPFQITIISDFKQLKENELIEIIKLIKIDFPTIMINLIYHSYHARCIFTNYQKIKSDKGFHKKNYKNKNDIEFRNIFTNDTDYFAQLDYCKKEFSNHTKIGDQFVNRLLR